MRKGGIVFMRCLRMTMVFSLRLGEVRLALNRMVNQRRKV